VTTGAMLVSSWHSCVERLFLSCGVALAVRASVWCITCVGTHERTVSDYSGKFPH